MTTPSPSTPPNVMSLRRVPAVLASAIAKRRAGNASVISISLEMPVSTNPRK